MKRGCFGGGGTRIPYSQACFLILWWWEEFVLGFTGKLLVPGSICWLCLFKRQFCSFLTLSPWCLSSSYSCAFLVVPSGSFGGKTTSGGTMQQCFGVIAGDSSLPLIPPPSHGIVNTSFTSSNCFLLNIRQIVSVSCPESWLRQCCTISFPVCHLSFDSWQ